MTDNSGNIPPSQPSNPNADAKAAKAYAKASRPWYKKKRYWLLAVVALIVIISVSSSGGGGESEPTATEKAIEADKGGSKEKAAKPMTVDAGTIIKDYEDNEAAADGKYSGKVLKVSGVIEKVDTDVWNDDEYVVMVGAGGTWDFLTVDCPGQTADAVSSLNKGDDITVIGEFDDGGDLGVTLKDCQIA